MHSPLDILADEAGPSDIRVVHAHVKTQQTEALCFLDTI